MKKLIIILSLIYFISSKSVCEDIQNIPTKKSNCYARESSFTENECCYSNIKVTSFYGQTIKQIVCSEFKIGTDLKKLKRNITQKIEEKGLKVDSFDLICPSQDDSPDPPETNSSSTSFLKLGFLLILCFIL